MVELREDWKRKGLALPINARMGIHTGICTVGNFGSEDRLDYTIIGNGVNLASRLESHARPNSILVSEDTYQHIQDEILCNKHQKFKVKGVAYPVQTYCVDKLLNKNVSNKHNLKKNFQGFSRIFTDFHGYSRIFTDFQVFSGIFKDFKGC